MSSFRKRPGDSPQKTGRLFEAFWAKVFGVQPTRGSGNQWFAKLDVGDSAVLWSCKHTDKESFRVDRELLREAERAINGPGGVGGSTIPGAAISVEGEVIVALRAEDFLRIVASDAVTYVTPSRGEQKRSRARIPSLLRDDSGDLPD